MLKTLIATALIAGTAAAATPQRTHHDRNNALPAASATDDPRLAKRLAGRVAGRPQQCITPSPSRSASRFGDRQLIEDRYGKLYLTQLQGGCTISHSDALISRRPNERLCRGEIVQVTDLVARVPRGACVYGDFTPYVKR